MDGNDQELVQHAHFPFQKIPFGSDPSFLSALKEVIKQWNIDCIVPGADEELIPCAKLREEGVVECVTPNRAFIETCLNKKQLMHTLHRYNISHLLPFDEKQDVRYPAIAKPVFGRGSRQVHRIDSEQQLNGYFALYNKTMEDTLLQPCIEGKEFTISVIVNNLNKLIGIVPKRVIEKRGITRIAVTERNHHIEQICSHIVDDLHPCGPFNVQLMVLGENCFIFEINPRLSTTAVLTEKAFGNEIDLYIRNINRKRPLPPPILQEGLYLFRSEAHHFFPRSAIQEPNATPDSSLAGTSTPPSVLLSSGKTYVVCGLNSWNQTTFDHRLAVLPGSWHFIGSREELTVERLRLWNPDTVFFLHWSWIVPEEIINAYECVNFHMTDLPYGRGGSPLQNLILRGHRMTKLTAHRMSPEVDAGPIYCKEDLDLSGSAEEILRRASELAATMIERILQESPIPQAQQGEVVLFERRKPEQSKMPPPASLEELYDFIRMLDAERYPLAFFSKDGFRYEFHHAQWKNTALEASVLITPSDVSP